MCNFSRLLRPQPAFHRRKSEEPSDVSETWRSNAQCRKIKRACNALGVSHAGAFKVFCPFSSAGVSRRLSRFGFLFMVLRRGRFNPCRSARFGLGLSFPDLLVQMRVAGHFWPILHDRRLFFHVIITVRVGDQGERSVSEPMSHHAICMLTTLPSERPPMGWPLATIAAPLIVKAPPFT